MVLSHLSSEIVFILSDSSQLSHLSHQWDQELKGCVRECLKIT